MRLKTYFAASVEGAMNLARQELGQEAMLLDSHRSSPESRHLGEYEVVCALVPALEPAAVSADPIPSAFPHNSFRAPSLDKLCAEVSELKRYMERMAATIARSSAGFASMRSNPEIMEAFAVLSAAEVDSSLAGRHCLRNRGSCQRRSFSIAISAHRRHREAVARGFHSWQSGIDTEDCRHGGAARFR